MYPLCSGFREVELSSSANTEISVDPREQQLEGVHFGPNSLINRSPSSSTLSAENASSSFAAFPAHGTHASAFPTSAPSSCAAAAFGYATAITYAQSGDQQSPQPQHQHSHSGRGDGGTRKTPTSPSPFHVVRPPSFPRPSPPTATNPDDSAAAFTNLVLYPRS